MEATLLGQAESADSVRNSEKNSSSEHRTDIPRAAHELTAPLLRLSHVSLRHHPSALQSSYHCYTYFTDEKTEVKRPQHSSFTVWALLSVPRTAMKHHGTGMNH